MRITQISPQYLSGMAGVVGETDLAHGRSVLIAAGIDPTRIPTGLDHDIRIALAGGLTGREGLALIVGTGASCYGRRNDGFQLAVRRMGLYSGRWRQRIRPGSRRHAGRHPHQRWETAFLEIASRT